ncbi:MAG: putative quinol monooxygenase [Tranquillimonas sp.]|jgi:quinol monooxygenase YgiN
MNKLLSALAAATLLAAPSALRAQSAPVLAVISHPVQDYARWRAVYDDFADEQKAGGVIMEQVYRDPADPDQVLVLHGFETMEAAESFLSSDELRSAMEGAGVAGPPDIRVMTSAD